MAPWSFRLKGSSSSSSAAKPANSSPAVPGPDQAPPRMSIEAMVKRATSKRKPPAAPPSDPPPRETRTYTCSLVSDRPEPVPAGRHKSRQESPNPMVHPVTWDLVPTLHHKRSNGDVVSRKSSLRRKPEQSREAEIKGYFGPVRAATHTWAPVSPSTHIYKRAKTMDAEPALPRPPPITDTSLLHRGSVQSTLSLESELKSYKVSALSSLTPRPTLKCVEARTLPTHASFPIWTASKKRPFVDCEPIPEEMLKAHKRVDDLADGFDASELRALMERDARRRERNQRNDREKVAHKLARRTEKQKLIVAEARQSGTPIPENLERGVMGRELVGVGVDPPSAVVTSSRPRRLSEPMPGANPEQSFEESRRSRRPLQLFHREDETPAKLVAQPSAEAQSKKVADDEDQAAKLPSNSKAEASVRSKKSMSKSTLGSDKEKVGSAFDDEAMTRKGSTASSKASRLSIIALLKWGMRGRRDLSSPSSFSNTSREEMQAAAAQMRAQGDNDSATSALTSNFISKSSQGISKQMRSRFREDLPEFPPNSRVQSVDTSAGELSSLNDMRDSPTTLHRSSDGLPPSSPSVEKISASQTAEPHLSLLFASVDSEGSWLASRINSQRSASRETAQAKGNGRVQVSKSWDSSLHQASIATDDEETRESDVKVMGFSTQPQAVQIHKPNRDTIRSHEVLLDIDSENEEDIRSQLSGDSGEKADLQHARRVSVSHIHNYSAGSAKIFQIAFSSGSLRGRKQT